MVSSSSDLDVFDSLAPFESTKVWNPSPEFAGNFYPNKIESQRNGKVHKLSPPKFPPPPPPSLSAQILLEEKLRASLDLNRKLENENSLLVAKAEDHEREMSRMNIKLERIQRNLALSQAEAENLKEELKRRQIEGIFGEEKSEPTFPPPSDGAAKWEKLVQAALLQAEKARWQEAKAHFELSRLQEKLAQTEKQLNEAIARKGALNVGIRMMRTVSSGRSFFRGVLNCFRKRYSAVNENSSDLAAANGIWHDSLNNSVNNSPVGVRATRSGNPFDTPQAN